MSDLAIDALDPLLPVLALQHDFRERFFHALTEIIGVLDEEGDAEARLSRVSSIARDAVDRDIVTKWVEENRPMPWLDDVIGEAANELTEDILAMIATQVEL